MVQHWELQMGLLMDFRKGLHLEFPMVHQMVMHLGFQ
jgi:hypothetical protein